jgi:hypothetical protein
MERKDADLWWDVLNIVQKDIGKVYKKYDMNESCINTRFFRWKKLCHHLNMIL